MGLIKDIKDIEPILKYEVTKKDCVGEISNIPLEILDYALKTQEEILGEIDLKTLQCHGIICGFHWDLTKDGWKFWDKINRGEYDEFYDKYPEYKQYE